MIEDLKKMNISELVDKYNQLLVVNNNLKSDFLTLLVENNKLNQEIITLQDNILNYKILLSQKRVKR